MVVVDNNILSSLSKINRLNLLNKVFDQVSTIPSVIEELHGGGVADSEFVGRIEEKKSNNGGWLKIRSLTEEELEFAEKVIDNSLSFTDAECIAAAKTQDKILLTDDKHVGEIASQNNIKVWDLKLFIQACIVKDLIETQPQLDKLIQQLETEDNYQFTGQDREDLKKRL
ncbi:hypothetical protein [Halobellus rubicundus]|uniref:PIN domain-containing protein n=1 Tax=Halobellus rubicundus TaxID=2996466 RepID=A0ABD5M812_9EURY